MRVVGDGEMRSSIPSFPLGDDRFDGSEDVQTCGGGFVHYLKWGGTRQLHAPSLEDLYKLIDCHVT